MPSPRCVNQECGGCGAVYTVLDVYSSHKYPNEQEPCSVLSRLNMTRLCATLILTILTRNIPSTEDICKSWFITRLSSYDSPSLRFESCQDNRRLRNQKKARYIVCRTRLSTLIYPPGRSGSRSRSRVTPSESWQRGISCWVRLDYLSELTNNLRAVCY